MMQLMKLCSPRCGCSIHLIHGVFITGGLHLLLLLPASSVVKRFLRSLNFIIFIFFISSVRGTAAAVGCPSGVGVRARPLQFFSESGDALQRPIRPKRPLLLFLVGRRDIDGQEGRRRWRRERREHLTGVCLPFGLSRGEKRRGSKQTRFHELDDSDSRRRCCPSPVLLLIVAGWSRGRGISLAGKEQRSERRSGELR